MNIVQENTIFLDVELQSKEDVLSFIADAAQKAGIASNAEAYRLALSIREKETTTGFGFGIAIPHAKIPEIQRAAVLVVKLKDGVEWGALDNQPVRVAIALAVPEREAGNTHLKLLSLLAKRLMHADFREGLLSASTPKKTAEFLTRNLVEGMK